jgi:hypothetical protein
MTPPSPLATSFDHVDDILAAALGPELTALWRMPSGPQLRTIWVGYSGADLAAAVLTTRRPATAATKVARTWRATDIVGSDAVLDHLVDTVINDARDRGDIAVKWQSFDDDLPPQHRGFITMRTPYRSAAGTYGVRGYVLWLNPATHAEPPYYAQPARSRAAPSRRFSRAKSAGHAGSVSTALTGTANLNFGDRRVIFPHVNPSASLWR